MTCQSCGHEIAANAIVCYRCGAPTAVPAPAANQSAATRGSGRLWLVAGLVIAALVCAALILGLGRHLL